MPSFRQSLDVETPGRTGQSRPDAKAGNNPFKYAVIALVVLSLAFVSYLAYNAAHHRLTDSSEPPSQSGTTTEVKPPWWILKDVLPKGPEKDMGGYKAITFSAAQQEQFGINELGTILDRSKFDKATAADKVRAIAPWWILAHVKPNGPLKDKGTWSAVTFSPEQQKQFGIDEFGEVQDEEKFNTALASIFTPRTGMQILPPWWILHNVTPAGPDRDMGGWTSITFSKDQQEKFGIDELGVIRDKDKFDAAIAALENEDGTKRVVMGVIGGHGAGIAPWWIQEGMVPNGPKKDMGSWTASTFSTEQQEQFGIDEQGTITDQTKFDEAIKEWRAKGKTASSVI